MSIEYGISCCIISVILASFTLQSPSKFLLFLVPDSLIREAQYSLPVRHAWLDKNSRRMEQGAGCKLFLFMMFRGKSVPPIGNYGDG